jgi:hypothetical protein
MEKTMELIGSVLQFIIGDYPIISVLIMILLLCYVCKNIKKLQYLKLDAEEARFKANKYKYGMYRSMRKMSGDEE